ncbi:MAG: PAS domain-containing protein [Desulfobacteraceae bacterium]|jgi:PAS domain S-box-containing protein
MALWNKREHVVNSTRKNIKTLVMTGFALVIVLLVSFGGLSVYTVKYLSDITRAIYDHPLQVSNAALSCKWAISELDLLMIELASKPASESTSTLWKMERIEELASGYLRTVEENILGEEGKARAADMRGDFSAWVSVINNIATLVREGKGDKSLNAVKARGQSMSMDLEKKAQELTSYARAKASNFMDISEKHKKKMLTIYTGIFFIMALLFSIAALVTGRWIDHWAKDAFEREARFLGAFEHANSGVALVSPNGHFIKVNSRLAEIMEYSVEDLEQSTVDRITHPDDFHISRSFMNEAVAGRMDRAVFEKRYITRSGSIVYGEVSITLVRDNKGTPMYFVSHVKDVSDSKKAVDALKKSESRYALSHRIGGIGTFEWDIREKTVYWAEETKAIFGLTTSEFKGDYNVVRERLHPDDYSQFLSAISESIREKKEFRIEMRIILPNNDLRYIRALGDVAWDSAGRPEKMTGVLMDITKRKQDEEKQHELERKLARSQKMEAIGRLAGGVAHDFNNLLSIILGYTELMKDDVTEDHPHYTGLCEIFDASIRARAVTRQLLAFGRKQVLEIGVFDVNRVILGFEKLLRRMISEDVDLHLNLRDQPAIIKADSSQLEQVLMNLVVNARDAIPNGGKISIETSIEDIDAEYVRDRQDMVSGRYVMIAVSDTGMGIAKEDLDMIYEPFFTTKEQDKGSGMGLATVYGIVKQHGGNILVYSEPGHGTLFKIYLPLATEANEPQILDQKTHGATSSRTATILVVEDDEALCVLTMRILEKGGYRVLSSHKPWDAIEKARKYNGHLDLLITDVIMPDLKGPDVFRKLVESHPNIRVLYMSGYTENMITRHGVLKEGISFIQKPFSKHMLLECVEKTLNAPCYPDVELNEEADTENKNKDKDI